MVDGDGSEASVLLARRTACWAARDAFWACADASLDAATSWGCWRLKRAYHAACPPSWVKHFDAKRVAKQRVAAALARSTQNTPPASQ